jgi:hypothetical protein
VVVRQCVDHPIHSLGQYLACDRPTGFADGRQHAPSPVLRTALVPRAHVHTVRCADERDVAGLPLARAYLTVAQAQQQLPVAMKGLSACPRRETNSMRMPPHVGRVLINALLAAVSRRSCQNNTLRTGWSTVGIRIRLVQDPSRRLPTRPGLLSAHGICRATSCSCYSRPSQTTWRLRFKSPTEARWCPWRWLSTFA